MPEQMSAELAATRLSQDPGDWAGDSTQVSRPSIPLPTRRKPDPQDVRKRTTDAENLWAMRNLRFVRHQTLFNLPRRAEAANEILVTMNDPKVIVEKMAGVIARKEGRIEVPPRGEHNHETAQKIENALRWWRDLNSRQWQAGLHNHLDYDMALSIFLRGWTVTRMLLDPEDDVMLVREELFEPYHVYPVKAGNRIQYVIHKFAATVGELAVDFPNIADKFDAGDEDTLIQCVGYYENRTPYWFGILGTAPNSKSEWVKEPVELGYFPWILSIARGAIGDQPLSGDMPSTHAGQIGEGVLSAIENEIRLLDRIMTMIANIIVKHENPAVSTFTQTGEPREVDLAMEGRTAMKMGEQIQVMDVGAKVAEFLPILSTIQDRLNKGGLPGAMWGEGTALQSGFMAALLMSAATDSLWPYVSALEHHHSMRYQKFLEILEKYSPDTGFTFASPAMSGILKGEMVYGASLLPVDIQTNGTYVRVKYEDVSPQDRVALGNLAALLVREKLIDMGTARDKYLGLDDPGNINDKVIAELVNMHPEAIKLLTQANLLKLGRENELVALVLGEQKLQTQTQSQGTAPPSQPGTGLPPEALPPEMAGSPQLSPEEQQLADQLVNSALPPAGQV